MRLYVYALSSDGQRKTESRSSSDDDAIYYLIPVLWMTSYFHHGMSPIDQNQKWRYVSSSSADSGTGAKLLSTIASLFMLAFTNHE